MPRATSKPPSRLIRNTLKPKAIWACSMASKARMRKPNACSLRRQENNPEYSQAFANLGLIQASQGRLHEATTTLARAVQLDANNTAALTAYGMVLERLEHSSEALAAFRKVAELQPQSPEAHLNLGNALADGHDWPQAIAQLKQAIEICGNCSTCHNFTKTSVSSITTPAI